MKNTSQTIINNLGSITHEQKKQHTALRGLAEFTTGGGNADEDQMVNWFDVVTKKHMNELGLLIKNA